MRSLRRRRGETVAVPERDAGTTRRRSWLPGARARRSRRRLGLRIRFAVALMATSVATLVGAGVALVPPLDRRLELDRLHTVEQVTRQARPALSELDASQLRPEAPALQTIVRGLARRVGGRVSVAAADGTVLADSDPDARFQPRIAAAGSDRHKVLRQGRADAAATVSTRVRTAAGTVTIALFKPLRDTRAALAVVRRALPIAALAGLLVALALAGLLSRTLLTRLARLRDGARALVGDGLSRPLPRDDSSDEVGELSRALERMRARLHDDARARHAFLTTASHELRTPLASLAGTLELLSEDLAACEPALRERGSTVAVGRVRGSRTHATRDPGAASRGVRGSGARDARGSASLESAARRAVAARHQAEQLTRLTADLLDLGRLDADIPPRRELVDVGELAEIVASEFAADRELRADERVSVRVDGGSRWALADPVATVRILRILVDNALAHGPSGGAIAVEVVAGARERTYVVVRDEGPGIGPSDHERVFARFERGTAVRHGHARGGFGLGLAIARGLALRMEGSLTLDPGAPTTFRLALPAAGPLPVGDEERLAEPATTG
ncbi:MAG TPA: HAMP domain-containing sensor histidine kinase [Solirubrobacteraceae bacterium]|nr:HAMP domain-containing sensor histidine kinase [Solirubrobacteraceae bacterium]